jgi:hypothetical protein
MGTLATKLILHAALPFVNVFLPLLIRLNPTLLVFFLRFPLYIHVLFRFDSEQHPPPPHNKLISAPKPQITQYLLRFPAERHRRGITQKLGSFMENDQPYVLLVFVIPCSSSNIQQMQHTFVYNDGYKHICRVQSCVWRLPKY